MPPPTMRVLTCFTMLASVPERLLHAYRAGVCRWILAMVEHAESDPHNVELVDEVVPLMTVNGGKPSPGP